MPLPFERPSPRYLRELVAVSEASRGLTQSLGSNALPDNFPVVAITELGQSLESLPKGTAEGSIQILLQARNRLPSWRNDFFDFEDHLDFQPVDPEARPIEKRDGFVDTALVKLIAAVSSAIEQYQKEAGAEVEPDVDIDQPVPAGQDFGVANALETLARVDAQSKAILEKLNQASFVEGGAGDTAQRLLNDASNQSHAGRSELLHAEPRPSLLDKLRGLGERTLGAMSQADKWAPIGAELVGDVLGALGDWGKASWDDAIGSLKVQMVEGGKFLTKVSTAIRKAQASAASPKSPKNVPPFDLEEAHAMILRGEAPPKAWVPFIAQLFFQPDDEVSDLSPLRGLVHLKKLTIWKVSATDFSPMSELLQLEELIFSGSGVTELSWLSRFNNLKELCISHCQARDISVVGGLKNLRFVEMIGTNVSDISPLSELPHLDTLNIGGNKLGTLQPLLACKALKYLDAYQVDAPDMWVLDELEKRGVQISSEDDDGRPFDLAEAHAMILRGEAPPEAWVPMIITLDFGNMGDFSDLTPLGGLTALRYLNLYGTQVSDLTPLAGLTALETLILSGTKVTDITPLENLVSLEELDLSGTQISELLPIGKLRLLTRLQFDGTAVSDLRPLVELYSLKELTLGGTKVIDLSALSGLIALERLELGVTNVSDLAPLVDLTSMTLLYLNNTKVSDLKPLSKMSALETLYLDKTPTTDVTALTDLTALKHLSCGFTNISDWTPLQSMIEKGLLVSR
jgi:Leucine-rich repeat (LRR) protein